MQEQFSGQVKGLDFGLTVKMALVPIVVHFIVGVSESFSSKLYVYDNASTP